MTSLAEKIRAARKEAGYASQDAFAAAIPTTRRTVVRWETGDAEPGAENLVRISRVVRKPVEWFHNGNGDAAMTLGRGGSDGSGDDPDAPLPSDVLKAIQALSAIVQRLEATAQTLDKVQKRQQEQPPADRTPDEEPE